MFKQFFLSEKNMMIAIALNAVVIFLLYFPALCDSISLDLLDYVFVFIFLIEAFIKMRELGTKAYFANNWNRFDFVIVMASLPSLLIYFLPIPDTSLFLLLRLFRLVRLIRFITFIPHVDKILAGLGRAIQSSVFVLLALLFLNFMLGIFTCHFYGEIAPELFGNPLQSIYSIFQMFTVEGWNEIPSTVAEGMENPIMIWLMRFYFVLVVLIGGIFGMSLANAVFVDEMTVDNNLELEEKIDHLQVQIKELKQLLLQEKG